MAKNLQVDETIFVPVSKLKANILAPSSFVERHVLEVVARKVRIDVEDNTTELIASSFCHRNIGILIFSIGDLKTETTLLDPLAKSVLQFCRLLVPDHSLKSFKVRSISEVEEIWRCAHGSISHVILIGHGSKASLRFACDGPVTTGALFDKLACVETSPKNFISLCCETGYKAFGGAASAYDLCGLFIGPFHSVHGATASQFAQTFLTFHLLEGETARVAFKHARAAVAGSASFRLWKDKHLISGPK